MQNQVQFIKKSGSTHISNKVHSYTVLDTLQVYTVAVYQVTSLCLSFCPFSIKMTINYLVQYMFAYMHTLVQQFKTAATALLLLYIINDEQFNHV